MHYMDANKTYKEKACQQLHKNTASNIALVLETAPHEAAAVRPPTTHHENYHSLWVHLIDVTSWNKAFFKF